ncbi:MAG: hypothetical protein K0S39_1579 [Paenibacillus sp.]|jgi:hypothetical protein|nr:hypothetical protein [Paenibacillus sp.]
MLENNVFDKAGRMNLFTKLHGKGTKACLSLTMM